MEENSNKKILVFCLGGIGDALMASPMIERLGKRFDKCQIDVACMFSGSVYVFKNNPHVNEVFSLSLFCAPFCRDFWRGVGQVFSLRKRRYDISILTFPAYRAEYHLVQWFAGARKRLAHKFKKGFWRELHFLNTDMIEADESLHNVENNLNLSSLLDREETARADGSSKYVFSLDEHDKIFGRNFVKQMGRGKEKIIGIHPGSTNSPAALLRRWPINKYKEVIKFLTEEKKAKVLIFLGRDEKELERKLKSVEGDACKIMRELDFGKTLGVLSETDLFICNDNGFGHLAVALKKPIVTLWASTNDKWSLPYDKKLVTLIRPDNFEPWYRYDLKRQVPKFSKGGMEKIKTEDVLAAINEKLSKTDRSRRKLKDHEK